MTNKEKADAISAKYGVSKLLPTNDECIAYSSAMEMAEWKDAQLDKAFDKVLEHHQNKLKEGKITQYGMDNVFAFVQNVRTLLNSEQ